ncbi:hypothetical protein F2P47_03680 [Parvibaculum sedimenti]|uniref:Uncharacterized protein n=1 Tax=Parvibaculum sedimenti TaxID=2608632 RepID=A0A6N6VJV3_9HYPH|nr:hypothetical protein [Parvibaculum sedimenti]KAB7741519.1 hypothetical protein F2P47_03680 [Parvibaculum sedimenti]
MDTTDISPIDWDIGDEISSTKHRLSVIHAEGAAKHLPRHPDAADDDLNPSTDTMPQPLLTNWGRLGRASISIAMYESLVRIAMYTDGWHGPGSLGLRSSSLKRFIEFWSLVRNDAAEPEISLSSDGSLHTEWYKSARQRLDLRFADQSVFFGLFSNNTILEGADSVDTVAQILRLHRAAPLRWKAK